jgi:flagellar biosynthetic protein FliQ
MTPDVIVDLFGHAVLLMILMLSVIILPGLLVGLCISVFQAVTQINEQTLSFVPRLLVTLLVLSLAGPWLLNILIDYTETLFVDIPLLIG